MFEQGTIHKRRLPKGGGRGVQKMPKKETFTSRFEETRGGRVPQKSKIWGDVVYGWSLRGFNNSGWLLKKCIEISSSPNSHNGPCQYCPTLNKSRVPMHLQKLKKSLYTLLEK